MKYLLIFLSACLILKAKKDLCYYAYADDTGNLERLLAKGKNPNKVCANGKLPLETACQYYSFDAAEVLLRNGAKPDVYFSHSTVGWFELAIIRGLVDLVDLLASYGADPDLPDTETRQSPIQRAIRGGNDMLALTMLKYGADPFQIDNEGRNLLLIAAMYGGRRIAIKLLSLGLYPDMECIHVAQLHQNDELVEIFYGFRAHMELSAARQDPNSAFSTRNFNTDCRETIQGFLGDLTRRAMP